MLTLKPNNLLPTLCVLAPHAIFHIQQNLVEFEPGPRKKLAHFFKFFTVFIALLKPWRGHETVITDFRNEKEIKIDRNDWNEFLREHKWTLMEMRKAQTHIDYQIRNSNYTKGQEVQARDFAAQSKQRAELLKLFSQNCTFKKEADREVLQGLINNFQEQTSRLLESAIWLEKSATKVE